MEKELIKEKIVNIPNALTFSRIIITFAIVFFIFADFSIYWIAITFIIGMLTDFFDGQIARRFNMKTEFGRQFDMVADRFLMIMTGLSAIIRLSLTGEFSHIQLFQIFLLLTREIVASPIIFSAVIFGKGVPMPHVRNIGKATTFFQGVTFPMILLSMYYPVFKISIYFALLTALIGMISGIYYIRDIKSIIEKQQ